MYIGDINKAREWLEKAFSKTPNHLEGSILGSMTTMPHELGVEAFLRFIHINGNDPMVFPIVKEAEEIIVKGIGGLFDVEHGMYTSGGTESNIMALYVGRRVNKDKENTVVAPSSIHRSIDKACLLMGCKLVKIPVDPLKPVDPAILEEYIRLYKPFAVVVTAGTTEAGVIDPVKEAGELAEKYGVYLHVDAAYGGLLIPFLYRRGYITVDLRMFPGVSSLSVDMHKNGCAPIPSGLLFFSNRGFLEQACFDMEYMPLGKSCGLLGTRPGGAVVASAAVFMAMGIKGYEENAVKMMENSYYLYNGLKNIPELVVFKPILPINVFRSLRYSYIELFKVLAEKGVYVYKSPSLHALRVVVMPHVIREHLDKFINILKLIHGSG
ncbi:aminotransferase class V-fold PLP-dependent enzyme [Desulfurococcus amylolyticus]|uniref:Pyridoxal-dependent decarboxylase n=1 Tax=Desulfurococcus amylolyticus DSM 16532 TaxID=768672 RepID=I3XQ10_DESAM|nr:aminotransferase class V-fold PLP-dependent enzyme [Desulfurococcus amylolyticus]AFL66034.1 Pyridoxal-dependent decarboxylase [Desulfurococcus amylolyticus DSM 16532]